MGVSISLEGGREGWVGGDVGIPLVELKKVHLIFQKMLIPLVELKKTKIFPLMFCKILFHIQGFQELIRPVSSIPRHGPSSKTAVHEILHFQTIKHCAIFVDPL